MCQISLIVTPKGITLDRGPCWLSPLSVFPQAESLDGALCVPDIKLHSNPSAFNVYCNVRHCVLDWQQREASLALASRSSVQSGDSDSEEEEEYREPAVKLPKVWAGGSIGCLCGSSSAWYQGESRPVFFILGMQRYFISLGLYIGLILFIVVIIGVTLPEVWNPHPVRITASALFPQLPLLLY